MKKNWLQRKWKRKRKIFWKSKRKNERDLEKYLESDSDSENENEGQRKTEIEIERLIERDLESDSDSENEKENDHDSDGDGIGVDVGEGIIINYTYFSSINNSLKLETKNKIKDILNELNGTNKTLECSTVSSFDLVFPNITEINDLYHSLMDYADEIVLMIDDLLTKHYGKLKARIIKNNRVCDISDDEE